MFSRLKTTFEGVWNWDGFEEWPDLERLTEKVLVFPTTYINLTDEELIHAFDREIGNNPFLTLPTTRAFKPWDDYRVRIKTRRNESFNKSTVDHYYSYWQVHQLHFIQQYPDLYKNALLLDRLCEDIKRSPLRPSAPNIEYLVKFKGMQHYFNALSFWITVYEREHNRTFATIDEINGVRRLDKGQVDYYRKRLTDLVRIVVDRFKLTHQHLYEFLYQLIELYEDYRRVERYKLSDELEKDIFAWEHIIGLYTGDTREEMTDELSRRCPHWSVRTFRHLDTASKERDYAVNIINRVSRAQYL